MPRVSVIIIFFNAEAFFEEAIQSVLGQTYPAWELLLVDDGSSDRSTQLARGYASQMPERIRYLQHPGGANLGMSASRNLGIREARGEFVAFLDADDIYLPEKLERHVALLDAHPDAAMVYGPTLLWYSWSGRAEDRERDYQRHLGVATHRVIPPPTLIPRFLRKQALPPATCGILVRRTACQRVGGFEAQFRGMYEDQAFLYKLCLHEAVFVTDLCLDWYRQHDRSASALSEAVGFYDGNGPNPAHEVFLNWFGHHARASSLLDGEIKAALEDALWPYRHPIAATLQARFRSWYGKLSRDCGR